MNVLDVSRVAGYTGKTARIQTQTESTGLSLGTLIAILIRRASLIALIIAIGMTVALLYLSVAQSKYAATASLIPDLKRDPASPTEVTRETLIDPAVVENQIETIKSKTTALAVIDKLSLWKDPEFVGKPGFVTRAFRAVGLSDPEPSETVIRERAAAGFAQMLKVLRVGRSYVVEVSFTSVDPEKAATIANEVVDVYIQDQLGSRFFNAERSGRWMQQRISELSEQSSAAAKAIDDFKSTANLRLDANGKPAFLREQEKLAASLESATAKTAALSARNERLQSALQNETQNAMPAAALLDWINDPAINRLRDEARATDGAKAQVPADQTGTNDADADRDSKLAVQGRAIWDAVKNTAEATRKELEAARLREAAISRQALDIVPQAESERLNVARLKQLDSQYQGYRQLQSSLENRFARLKDFVQQQSVPVTEARIVAKATPPLRPSSPKTGLVLLLALAGCITVGAAAAFILEFADRTLRRPDQVEGELGLLSLGSVPRFNPRETGRQTPSRRDVSVSGAQMSELELGINNWLSGVNGETLRYVKVMLDESLRPKKGARTLAIVSPNADEGKTAIALGLAMLMARSGKRTLLIDADVRDPSLTRALQPSAVGSTALTLGASPFVVDSGKRRELGFHFLAVPRSPQAHPSEVLASDAIAEMLQELRARYDYIIVDTPSLKPYVDVAASASLFDAFVMIAEAGRTTLDDIRHAVNRSGPISERLLGVLINKGPATDSQFKRLLARGKSLVESQRAARA